MVPEGIWCETASAPVFCAFAGFPAAFYDLEILRALRNEEKQYQAVSTVQKAASITLNGSPPSLFAVPLFMATA
jgi:hypothetical protein